MKRNTTTIVAAIAFFALMPMTASADSGLFLGGSLGAATLDEDFDGLDVDSDSTSFRITVGWQFSDTISFEVGYHSFGRFEEHVDVGGVITDISVIADGFTLGLTGSVPLSSNFSLFGRVGAFFWDSNSEINHITVALPEDTNLFLGAGADVKVSETLSIIGDWTRYELEGTRSDVISIGFKLRF